MVLEKMIKGRKRHVLADTIGLPVGMIVHPANVQDRDGASHLLASARTLYPGCVHVFADGGYASDKLKEALEAPPQLDHRDRQALRAAKGSILLPRCWVVERTIAWLNRNCRLAKDVEATIGERCDLALHRQRQADVTASGCRMRHLRWHNLD